MIITQKQTIEVEEPVFRVCDCCGREMRIGSSEEEESISIENALCGYYSIFGDGNSISLDLCQYCTKKLLGSYLRITSTSKY